MHHLDPSTPTPVPRHHARGDPSPPAPELPGCTPVHLPRDEIETYEGRLEFRDARTETAWVCEPTSPCHEQPSQTLAALAHAIAAVRGSPIKCYGAMDLLVRDPRGGTRSVLQADQSVYLHPRRARLPGPSAMVVAENDFPDVVLEVDHSTDVRRGKLGLYESWGFPEVWVEVPDRRAEAGEWIVRCDSGSGSELLNGVGSGPQTDRGWRGRAFTLHDCIDLGRMDFPAGLGNPAMQCTETIRPRFDMQGGRAAADR